MTGDFIFGVFCGTFACVVAYGLVLIYDAHFGE